MKIVYFGSSSPLSLAPLQNLIKSEHSLSAIVVNDGLSSDFNVIIANTIQSLAYNNSIPVLGFNTQSTGLEGQLASIKPDLIISSCFSRRIPSSILFLARLGGINIHPSLLPRYRGPDPLFWQYRDGVDKFAVSLHQITEEFDAGDIISQIEIKLVDGLTVNETTQQLADHAAELIIKSLAGIEDKKITRVKQNQDLASYQSFPGKDDYTVSTSWTAKRIYNFINAYKNQNIAFSCDVYGRRLKLVDAISYQAENYPGMEGEKIFYKDTRVVFACQDGYIECEYSG
jgi:methionyl-tRNA formyltransferase